MMVGQERGQMHADRRKLEAANKEARRQQQETRMFQRLPQRVAEMLVGVNGGGVASGSRCRASAQHEAERRHHRSRPRQHE